MPFATGGQARIRTNTPAENAYNALDAANQDISLRQLRLSTGKRINNAADDVAAYITARALQARNGALKSALNTVGDVLNMTNILQDGLDNINSLITNIRDATATASSGAMGTDEKVALAKAAYRMAQQVQTVIDSTVFAGAQLLKGGFSADFFIGFTAANTAISVSVDMTKGNEDFNVSSNNFDLNALSTDIFGGVTSLDLARLDEVTSDNLGIFAREEINVTLTSLAEALNNVNKVASMVGGIANRMSSQEDLLQEQIVNYNAAISRLEDSDVAKEQLELVKSQFLQQASLTSLAQANQNPTGFLGLIRG